MFKKWLVGLLALTFLTSGCSNNTKHEVKNHQEKEVNEVEKDVGEAKAFQYHFPLTGLGSDEQREGRAVAVMINNHPQARPQSGLNKADIIYELLAEGDITRFLAIFQSEQPDNIGPVRSARDYFIELAKGYNAFYVAHGYSPEAKKLLNQGYIDNINGIQYDGTLFKRANFRKAPHNSYISFENIKKGAKQKRYNLDKAPSTLPFLSAEDQKTIEGEEAKSISISYSSNDLFNVNFKYDEEEKKYKRYSNGEVTADLDTKIPVLLDNVFIVEMEHHTIDDYGRREIDLTSGGRAYLLQQGKMREVEWKNIDGRILPFSNGKEVGFIPGKTWINVIPSNPGLDEIVSFTAK